MIYRIMDGIVAYAAYEYRLALEEVEERYGGADEALPGPAFGRTEVTISVRRSSIVFSGVAEV